MTPEEFRRRVEKTESERDWRPIRGRHLEEMNAVRQRGRARSVLTVLGATAVAALLLVLLLALVVALAKGTG